MDDMNNIQTAAGLITREEIEICAKRILEMILKLD